MLNYYEMLKIQPSATVGEIEVAYTELYNSYRRLVTHHDASVASQASQALQTLDLIKVTLTDPAKRAGYDAALGLNGVVGGLADLDSVLSRPGTPFSPQPGPLPRSGSVGRTDAWTCPRCDAVNPVRTRFCERCGEALGRNCPKCQALIKVEAAFCSECGVNIQRFINEASAQHQEEIEQQHEQRRRLTAEQQQQSRWFTHAQAQVGTQGQRWFTKALIVEGPYEQVFSCLKEAITKQRLSVKSDDPKQGYLEARSGFIAEMDRVKVFVQTGSVMTRGVLLCCSGTFSPRQILGGIAHTLGARFPVRESTDE